MTEKLYYSDAYIKSFTATVVDCFPRKNGFAVVLDKSAFYPEGGGQAGDSGFLGDVRVFDTHEKNDEILHYTESEIPVGTVLEGKIDWDRRFSLMQQHSGEHIVSGLIHSRFGFNNVGFHMGEKCVTIDFDGVLDMATLREIEYVANRKIWENSVTDIRVYVGDELKAVDYRSKKELLGDVRIVNFIGSDTCACCGTHVKSTGEIGCIRLLSVQNLRGGIRVEMLCGEKCFRYFQTVADENSAVAKALSVKDEGTSYAVLRLQEEISKLKIQISELNSQRFSSIAMSYAGCNNVLHFEHNISSDELCKLTLVIMEQAHGVCAVFSGDDATGYRYAIGDHEGKMREFVREMNSALSGRGGGKPNFVQGSVTVTKSEIECYFG